MALQIGVPIFVKNFCLIQGLDYLKKKMVGVSSARNFAIDYINTPYFVFMDSDDYIEPGIFIGTISSEESLP